MKNKINGTVSLAGVDLLACVPEGERSKYASFTEFKTCKMTCDLYQPYQLAERVFMVIHGEVQLYHKRQNKKYVFDTLHKGAIFGFLQGNVQPYGHFALGKPGARLAMLHKKDFEQLLKDHPCAMLKFTQALTTKIQEYQSQMQNIHAGADEIVLHELNRLNNKRKQSFKTNAEVPLHITHEQLAELTGLNRVTVTRSMKTLKERGEVRINKETGAIELEY